MHPRPRRRLPLTRRVVAVLAAATLALAACGDDAGTEADHAPAERPASGEAGGDDPGGAGTVRPAGPSDPVSPAELAAASGDAPAARGVDLDRPPGPAERRGLPDVGEVAAQITAADGAVTGCCLLVAATDEQRQRGLMEVTDLGGYQGMVFVWDHDTQGGFWMRNTPTPLSIAWFDADGEFVSATDMAPCSATAPDCPTYPPGGRYRFAVEVFQGDLDDLGVGPGSRLTLGGPCAEADAAA